LNKNICNQNQILKFFSEAILNSKLRGDFMEPANNSCVYDMLIKWENGLEIKQNFTLWETSKKRSGELISEMKIEGESIGFSKLNMANLECPVTTKIIHKCVVCLTYQKNKKTLVKQEYSIMKLSLGIRGEASNNDSTSGHKFDMETLKKTLEKLQIDAYLEDNFEIKTKIISIFSLNLILDFNDYVERDKDKLIDIPNVLTKKQGEKNIEISSLKVIQNKVTSILKNKNITHISKVWFCIGVHATLTEVDIPQESNLTSKLEDFVANQFKDSQYTHIQIFNSENKELFLEKPLFNVTFPFQIEGITG
jgi:hypothetical protein